MKRLPMILTLIFCVLAILILTGYVKVWAQTLPPPPDGALYVVRNVPAFNVGVPKVTPGQKSSFAVQDCGLTASQRQTHICVTVRVVDQSTEMPLGAVRIATCEMDDYSFSRIKFAKTNGSGFVSLKIRTGSEVFFSVDPPMDYGPRFAQFHQLSSQHALAIFELRKRR